MNTLATTDKSVLAYLSSLAKRRLDCDITTEEETRVEQLVGELLFRLMSTKEAATISVINHIYPLLELTNNLTLYTVLSAYSDPSIKNSTYEMFVEALNRYEPAGELHDFVAESFLNYITLEPRVPFTLAVEVLEYFDVRIHKDP